MPADDKPHQFTSSSKQWRRLKPLAREMRHKPTPTEEKLWDKLRNRRLLGAKFRRQHAIEGFIVDFVCLQYGLIIEVDGSIHEQQADYDASRQAVLETQGFRVLRIHNKAVIKEIDAVLELIGETLQELMENN